MRSLPLRDYVNFFTTLQAVTAIKVHRYNNFCNLSYENQQRRDYPSGNRSPKEEFMSYTDIIAQADQTIGQNGTWDGINPESVARMRMQNRFKTGLEIANYNAAIMRKDMAAYDLDPTNYTQSLGCWHGFIAQQKMIAVKRHFGTTKRRYIYLSGWMIAALRSEFGPLPDQSMHEKTSVPALIEEIYTFLKQADARELGGLFRDHVLRQFDISLTQQLDQLTARLVLDAQGQPQIDPNRLTDPRWARPYSGLYWQLDAMGDDGQLRRGVLRSRSLWDAELRLEADALANGALHNHDSTGPRGETLRPVERSLQIANAGGTLIADTLSIDAAGLSGAGKVLGTTDVDLRLTQ